MNDTDTGTENTAPGRRRLTWPMVLFGGYLLGLLAVVVWNGVQNLRVEAPYNIGDWLINYSGGFVRRGLIGSAVLLLSRIIGQPVAMMVVGLQIALYAVLYWTIWRLARPMLWRPWSVALALSPATLNFLLLNGGGALRKDLLFLLALSGLLLLLRHPVADRGVVLYLWVAATLIALSHEGLIVYWPYMLAAVAISRQSVLEGVRLCALPTAFFVALTALVSRFPGTMRQAMKICASVGGRAMVPDSGYCGGSILYLGRSPAFYRLQVIHSIETNHYLRDYGILVLLSFLPCAAGLWTMGREPRTRRSVAVLLVWTAVALLCSTILFVLAVDWGRWIYIHVFSLMLLLFFVQGRADAHCVQTRRNWPRGWKALVTTGSLAAYLICWHLPPTGYEGRGWGFLGMARRHLQKPSLTRE